MVHEMGYENATLFDLFPSVCCGGVKIYVKSMQSTKPRKFYDGGACAFVLCQVVLPYSPRAGLWILWC